MTDDYEAWDATRFAQYLKEEADLGNYYEMLIEHEITGKVAPRLSDSDLKEMGISNVGHRLRFKEAIEKLKTTKRKQDREKTLWEAEEVLWFSCWEQACGTCCGCCPSDPSTYRLTNTHLIIKSVDPCRCGPIRCCFGHAYYVDNVDLTHVTDADVKGVPAPCCQHCLCCGKAQDHIYIKTSSEGEKTLILHKGEGEPVSRQILNQVEEAQKMERD